jgi:hypothetical protein
MVFGVVNESADEIRGRQHFDALCCEAPASSNLFTLPQL